MSKSDTYSAGPSHRPCPCCGGTGEAAPQWQAIETAPKECPYCGSEKGTENITVASSGRIMRVCMACQSEIKTAPEPAWPAAHQCPYGGGSQPYLYDCGIAGFLCHRCQMDAIRLQVDRIVSATLHHRDPGPKTMPGLGLAEEGP